MIEARARRLTIVANSGAGAVGISFLIQYGGGSAAVGPARSDDLPYGDLLSLDRTGAWVWSVLAVAAVAAALAHEPRLWLAAGLAWLGFAACAFVVVATEGSTFGATRPGDVAAATALALVTGIPALVSLPFQKTRPVALAATRTPGGVAHAPTTDLPRRPPADRL